jgi:4-amino-4-deoxy-L-arabinose transferase-like glycosyltransferase
VRFLPASPSRAVALAWALVTFAVLAATAPAQGIGRDEGVYLSAGESYAAFPGDVRREPARFLDAADRRFAPNHEHPPLAKLAYGATHALFAEALGWTSHLQGARLGAFLFGALLSWLLAAWGGALAGLAGALLAPALFWAVPRHFYHGHPAALDMPITALWLAVVAAWARSLRAQGRPAARRWALATGLAFGAAVATKHNGWFLLPVLGLHAALTRLPALLRAPPGARLRQVPPALPAMALLGPVVFLASWPWLWRAPWPRLRQYLAFHLHHENYAWQYMGRLLREPPFPVAYPFVVTALTVPAAVLLLYVAGFLHGVARAATPTPATPPGAAGPPEARTTRSEELLLLLNAAFSLALIAWPTVPIFGGVKHWLPSMPFLALLGARALVLAGRALWPARGGAVTAALAAAALVPAAAAVAHFHPYGTAAYNELAGFAPGAASLGMQRQYWGDGAVGVLEAVNAHAVPGARVWWQETGRAAVAAWQRDGRIRPDLRWAEGPEGADVSVWHFHAEFRDKEYRTWTAFAEPPRAAEPARLPRPVAGVYLDEVPLVSVYARPGTWR